MQRLLKRSMVQTATTVELCVDHTPLKPSTTSL